MKNDAIIWTFKNNKSVRINPKMYGYVDTDNTNNAIRVSCKEPISNNQLMTMPLSVPLLLKKQKIFCQILRK